MENKRRGHLCRGKIAIRGLVRLLVLDKNGNIKLRKAGLLRRLLGLQGKLMSQKFHNIVTRQGDALIADALLELPMRTKVKFSSGFMQLGTGWSGSNPKDNTQCNAATGSPVPLDDGFPALKAAWGTAGDTTVIYRATFAAGSLDADGINEACLLNGNGTEADCLAYAQITPSVSISSSDTLQVQWEITIQGQ